MASSRGFQFLRLATTAAVSLLGVAIGSAAVRAQSTPPWVRIYGSITINGQNAPTGTVVTAFSGSTNCGTSSGDHAYNSGHANLYIVDVDSSIAACSTPGNTLTFQVGSQQANETTTVPQVQGSSMQVNLTVGGGSTPGSASVTYAPGWNLVGGPGGTAFTSAASTLYTLQAGDTNYESLANGTGITAGRGYWAYFSSSATVQLSGSASLPFTLTAPAGAYIMVGNPTTKAVTVSGADAIYTFNTAANSYSAAATTATLQPGQGAWVFSNAGGTITMQ